MKTTDVLMKACRLAHQWFADNANRIPESAGVPNLACFEAISTMVEQAKATRMTRGGWDVGVIDEARGYYYAVLDNGATVRGEDLTRLVEHLALHCAASAKVASIGRIG